MPKYEVGVQVQNIQQQDGGTPSHSCRLKGDGCEVWITCKNVTVCPFGMTLGENRTVVVKKPTE